MYNSSKSLWNPSSVWTLRRVCCPDLSVVCCRDVVFRSKDLPQSIFLAGSTFDNSQVNALVSAPNHIRNGSYPVGSGYPAIRGVFNGGSRVR